MSNVNEIFINELSKSVGISYSLKSNVLGDQSSPKSALFNLRQIATIINTGRPYFGVVKDVSFTNNVFYNDGNRIEFQFSQAQVFFKNSTVTIPSQSIPINDFNDVQGTKSYKFYLDYNDFILSQQIFRSTVTAVTDNSITVDSLPRKEYIENFKTINANNYLIGVSAIDINDKVIYLNNNPTNFLSVNSTITLIYQPIVKFVSSISAYSITNDIVLPSSALEIAEAQVIITGTTTLSYTCPAGVVNTFQPYESFTNPVEFFPNEDSYRAFYNSVVNASKAYSGIQNYQYELGLLNSFESYTREISELQTDFDNYWSSLPYKPSETFEYGINYDGFQKVDFDKRFKDFWNYVNGVDLTRTLAIFRGDIYSGNNYNGGTSNNLVITNNVNSFVDLTNTSTLTNGTHSYAVTAVSTVGETIQNFSSNTTLFNGRKINNYISWNTSPNNQSILFYNVYRNVKNESGFEQERITDLFNINNITLHDTILNPTISYTGIGSSKFAITLKSNDSSSGVIGGIGFYAFAPDLTPLAGIQSCRIVNPGRNYINPYAIILGEGTGASISLSTGPGGVISTATITSLGSGYINEPQIIIFDAATNSGGNGAQIVPELSKLRCGIYTGNASNPIGPVIYECRSINIASISSSFLINMPLSNNFGILSSNTFYWAYFEMNTPYSLGANNLLRFRHTSGFSTSFATSNDGLTWTTNNTSAKIFKLGFCDNGLQGVVSSSRGVMVYDDKSAYPTRLQIFVPELDLSESNFDQLGPLQNFTNLSTLSTTPIQNSVIVSVNAYNSVTGLRKTLTGSLPRNTSRGTSILLGDESDVFDIVEDVFVSPDLSTGVNYINNTSIINWTIFDFFVINTVP